MLKKLLLSLLLITTFSPAENFSLEDQTVTKEFLIAKSTKSYNEAQKVAQKLSKDLNITLNLRDLKPHKTHFLTFSKKECEMYGYPCYVPRGRYDDGEYISIEHTNYYEEFTNGYYIVMVASGNKLGKSLKKVQSKVKDAYVKKAKVYMGCMH
jgi:hypothetical protein